MEPETLATSQHPASDGGSRAAAEAPHDVAEITNRNGHATAMTNGRGPEHGHDLPTASTIGRAPAHDNGHPAGTTHLHAPARGNGPAGAAVNGHAPAAANGHTPANGNRQLAALAPRPASVVNGHSQGNIAGRPNGHLSAIQGPAGLRPAVATSSGLASDAWRALPVHASAPPHVDVRPSQKFYLRGGKRLLDIAGASLALAVTAPLVAILAIIIKLESRGSVFYRSTRIGRGGRPFTFYKLRSMVDGADQNRHHFEHLNEQDGPVFKISRDPRVTRVGRWLRTTSIDEIPQFLNVLRGEMSLVGPRPPLPEEVERYEPPHMRRLDVRPGITCLWQISGRSRIGFREWMRLDLEYIRHQSFSLDVRILLRTIPAVMSREGAY